MIKAHLLISLGYLAAFTLINRFMLERYSNQFAIFVLIYIPFVLYALWQTGGQHWKKVVVVVLLFGMSLDTLHNSNHEKVFIRDAKDWLLTHTPGHATLVSNDNYIAYFSGREFDWGAAKRNKFDMGAMLSSEDLWYGRDYMAMRVRLRDTAEWDTFLKKYSLKETAVFDGGRHGKISIVKITGAQRH